MKEGFVVIAYRDGDNTRHSYTVGVFSKQGKAKSVAVAHAEYRGGKYVCVVEKCVLDHYDKMELNYSTEVYRTQ